MVNAEHGVAGWLSVPAWNVLMTLGVLLVWAMPRDGWGAGRSSWLRVAGVLLLLFVAIAYRGQDDDRLDAAPALLVGDPRAHRLGATSASPACTSSVGDRPAILTGLVALYGCVALADKAGGFGWPTIPGPLVGGIVGTHGALVLAGALLGVLLIRHQREHSLDEALRAAGARRTPERSARRGCCSTRSRASTRPSRSARSTRRCPGASSRRRSRCAAWVAVLLIVDVLGLARWPRSVVIAGENPLLAYLMAPLLLSLFALSAPLFGGTDPYAALGATTVVGLVRSAVFAWLVVRLSGWLRSKGVRFQL